MKKSIKIILAILIIALLVIVLMYFKTSNSKEVVDYEVEKPFYTSISTKAVATGKLNPEEEIELKPQISGIVDKIVVEEGDVVKKGDLIAVIRVVPNEQSLVSARSRIASSKLTFNNNKVQYDRDQALFNKGVISKLAFERTELTYKQSQETLQQAKNDYQIIKQGSISRGSTANTNIIAQIPGTILEIPVREGDQVIQSNNFNAGTTIATIADMSLMIFEGNVDEAEVGKLKEGRDIKVVLGAVKDKTFPAKLNFIAPKGKEVNGAVQFTIKATVTVDSTVQIRAGYSANAEMDLEAKDSVLCVKEALLQFNRSNDKPFVEILTGKNKFKKRNVKLGISDGVNVEILKGVSKDDKIKVWNKIYDEKDDKK